MKLAEFYVHAIFRDVDRSEFSQIAEELQTAVLNIYKEFATTYGAIDKSEFEYYLDEGSLKGLGRILTAIMGAYVAVSQYSDFRKSTIQLYHDVRDAGNAAIIEFQRITGAPDRDIIYRRTISRDVNRLHRIVQNADSLVGASAPTSEFVERRDAIIADLAGLQRDNPSDTSVQRLLEVIPRRHFPPFPKDMAQLMVVENEQRRRVEAPAGTKRPVGGAAPRPRTPRFQYHRMLRL